MITNFSLDSFRITDTRSRHEDTDFVTVSIAVGNKPAITKTKAMGNVNNGTHPVGRICQISFFSWRRALGPGLPRLCKPLKMQETFPAEKAQRADFLSLVNEF